MKRAKKIFPFEITNIQVYPFNDNQGKTKAFARITLNDALQLTSLRIIHGANGYFVAYPMNPDNEEYSSVYYPLTKELREYIEIEILKKYEEIIDNG